LYSEREMMFLEVCRHFAAKPLNRMQRVSPIRYNLVAAVGYQQ